MTADPAQRLREAAAKLRALLTDLGDCRGPWYVVNREQHPYPQRIDNIGVPYVVASTTTDPSHSPTIADYICAMHPGVGEALAAWLERAAHAHEATLITAGKTWASVMDPRAVAFVEHMTNTEALALADAVLGTTPG